MAENDIIPFLVMGVLIFVFGFFIAFVLYSNHVPTEFKEEAIKRGYAEEVIVDHEVVWRWK